MSVTEVKLKRLDDLEAEEVLLEGGESFLGRGPLLQIDATNISRKHARVNIVSSVEGDLAQVLLTCQHKNFIFVKTAGDWQELHQGETVSLKPLDEIKFQEDKFHFQVSFTGGGGISAVTSPTPDPVVITPKPTGLKVEKKIKPNPTSPNVKKRKLPGWMTDSESPPKKKIATKEKSPTSREIYEKNVKLVNSSLTVGRNKEDEVGSYQDLRRPGPSTATPFPIDEDRAHEDLAGPGPSKPVTISPQIQKPKVGHQLISDDEEKGDEGESDKENKYVAASSKAPRPSCAYGAGCYRKNPLHRQEESHPGDDDYEDPTPADQEEEEEEEGDNEDKPECEYGLDCYRKNPQHRKEYKHTRHPQPKRAVKVKNDKKKKKNEDEYDSEDSFIDDEEDGWEPVDDSDEDADYKAPANMSSELEYEDQAESSDLE